MLPAVLPSRLPSQPPVNTPTDSLASSRTPEVCRVWTSAQLSSRLSSRPSSMVLRWHRPAVLPACAPQPVGASLTAQFPSPGYLRPGLKVRAS